MPRDVPTWIPFDPDTISLPEPIRDYPDRGDGRVLLALAGKGARHRHWAARAAAALARALAGDGARLFLADLSFDRPVLHEVFGDAAGEGMSDTLLYGASIRRIGRDQAGGAFRYASAGTLVHDPAALLECRRWDVVVDGFVQAGTTLVLYAPDDLPGLNTLLERADDVVVLAADAEEAARMLEGRELSVPAVLGPPPVEGPTTAAAAAAGHDVSGQTAADPLATPSAPAPAGPGDRAGHSPEKSGSEGSRRPRRGTRVAWVVAGLVLLLAAGAAAVLGVFPIGSRGVADDVASGDEAAPAADLPPEVAAEPPEPVPTGDVLAWSVLVDQWFDRGLARLQAVAVAGLVPDHHVFLSPVRTPDGNSHRLMVGGAPDSAGTAAIIRSLAQALPLEDPEQWSVVETRLALQVGDTMSVDAAREGADDLWRSGVPAYVLATPYTDGEVRYRIVAGGYASEREAEAFREILAAQGVTDVTPTERIGRPPE